METHAPSSLSFHRIGTKQKIFPSMAAITLRGMPNELKERIQELADREHRSLSQQAIYLLERAVAEEPTGFERAYCQFREKRGPSPLEEGDLSRLRSDEERRQVDP